MSNPCAVTVPLSKIARIQIYVNTRRQTLTKIMRQTGADYGINGTLYDMRTLAVNCHLKADGNVMEAPAYTVAGYAWDTGPDIRMDMLPNDAQNYIACTPLIVSGKALEELTYDPGQGGKRGRSAIGIKCDRLALYCSRDGSAAARTPEALRDDLAAAGWTSAIMLDGGGSSQCDFAGQRITSSRRVQHCILVYLNDKCPYMEPHALIRKGSTGTGAKWVQWELNKHGGDLAVDGIFGTESDRTLRAFQRAFGLEVDGICGPASRKLLKTEKNKTARTVLYVAASQVGVTETPSGTNKTKYGKAYGLDGQPWCMMFVWWVFQQAGFNLYKTASCTALVDRYRSKSPGQIIRANYRPGDIVFFDFSGKKSKTEHVGIVESVMANGTIITIEGNTGTGNDANGGAVMRRSRKENVITCAVRPEFSQ